MHAGIGKGKIKGKKKEKVVAEEGKNIMGGRQKICRTKGGRIIRVRRNIRIKETRIAKTRGRTIKQALKQQ